MGNVAVGKVFLEEPCLVGPGILHRALSVDVLLTSVYDADETEFEGVHATGEDVQGVGASIHEVEFGKDTDGALALGIDRTCELEGIRVGEIDIGGRHGQNHTTKLTVNKCNREKLKSHQLGLVIKSKMRFRICRSISEGWSPTGI